MSKRKEARRISATRSTESNRQSKSWWSGLKPLEKLATFGLIAALGIGAIAATGSLSSGTSSSPLTGSPDGKATTSVASSSVVNTVLNTFTPPTATPTPQLSKEYIYAGSRMLAVSDANAEVAAPSDLAVWRPPVTDSGANGTWYVLGSNTTNPVTVQGWGIEGDVPAPGDYDGDGQTDFCIFRPSNGQWWILKSSDNNYYVETLGIEGDQVAQADYDGDGKTDVAVFRGFQPTGLGYWKVKRSSDNALYEPQYGLATDNPVPADYDGDGLADVCVWRGSTNTFYSINSSNGQAKTAVIGQSSTEPAPGDYDGDGRADYAIRNGATWLIRQTSNNELKTINWNAGTNAVQNDYDGDGKVDIAIWNSANGNWYIRQSSRIGQSDELRQAQWGITGDTPVPAFYRR